MTRSFEIRHVVAFEETNLVGNVYYARILAWQGRCRELFLREHAPELLHELRGDLSLATTRCSGEFLAEIHVFDEVVIRMRLVEIAQNRVTMGFEVLRVAGSGEELVARGEQQIATLRRQGEELLPAPIPPSLRAALESYR